MPKILILYGTTEGHTRKVCTQVCEWVEASGHTADLIDSADIPATLDLSCYNAFLLAGSLHEGKHQDSLVHFVKANVAALSRAPSAFLSVSLSAVTDDDKHRADAQKCIDAFTSDTGWTPTMTTPVAGALLYTRYDWLKRALMKMISKKEGGATDTSQDYEYTDWIVLEAFVDRFLEQLPTASDSFSREPARIGK